MEVSQTRTDAELDINASPFFRMNYKTEFTSGRMQCQGKALTIGAFYANELHRRNISRVTCKPKQGCHTLHRKAAPVNDHVEFDISTHQRQMERPDDGRCAKRHQEKTGQCHQTRTDRAGASQPREQTNKKNRGCG